jgi:hypothetical protein
MEFNDGQRIITIRDGCHVGTNGKFNYQVGQRGTMTNSALNIITFDNGEIVRGCSLQNFKEYKEDKTMDYKEAFKAMIDGKMVVDELGIILKFNQDTAKFYFKNKGRNDFREVSSMPKNSAKYTLYIPEPKFKRGDYVESSRAFHRISTVTYKNGGYVYGITASAKTYEDKQAYETVSEDKLKEAM